MVKFFLTPFRQNLVNLNVGPGYKNKFNPEHEAEYISYTNDLTFLMITSSLYMRSTKIDHIQKRDIKVTLEHS